MSGIDFVVVSYYEPAYIDIVVKSIRKYVTGDYCINVVLNENPTSDEYLLLQDTYKNASDVNMIQGTSQTSLEDRTDHWFMTKDGHRIGPGSINHSEGLTIGLKQCNKKYVCFLDNDIIFLNKWVDDILPLLDENFLVSFQFDDGKGATGIIREMFVIFKRKNFVNNNLYPNVDYVDGFGNVTKFCIDYDKKYHILANSFRNPSKKVRHKILPSIGVESYINDVPFFYHFARGSTRDTALKSNYLKSCYEYLNEENK